MLKKFLLVGVIIIACIGILLGIAYWRYIRYISHSLREHTNKHAGCLLTLISTQKEYYSTHGKYGTLKELGDAGYIDPVMASGSVSGYKIEVVIEKDLWNATAIPLFFFEGGPSSKYIRYFADNEGIVRYSKDGTVPNKNSPPLPERYMRLTFFDWLLGNAR